MKMSQSEHKRRRQAGVVQAMRDFFSGKKPAKEQRGKEQKEQGKLW